MSPLIHIFHDRRGALIAAAGFSLTVNLLAIAVPLYMLQLYDRVLAARSIETLVMLTLITALALITMGLLDFSRGRVMQRLGVGLDRALGERILAASICQANGRGGRDADALRDLTVLRQFVANGALTLFDTPWVPLYLFLIFMLHPLLGGVATLGAVVLIALAMIGEWLTTKALNHATRESLIAQRFADQAVREAGLMSALGMLGNVLRRWRRQADAALGEQARAVDRAAWIAPGTRVVRQFLQVMALGVGAWLVMSHEITAGVMIAGSILLARGLQPIEAAIGQWRHFGETRDAWRRLNALLEAHPEPGRRMPLPTPLGALQADRLVFAPGNGGSPIIKGVSFDLNAGESLAIIGPSGAGKSTLAALLAGALPATAGAVRLDQAELNAANLAELGPRIGWLPQQIELFPATVKDNIARLADADDPSVAESVLHAARRAGVHDMILRLPQGYETLIGPGGVQLSGGQRQRIGLARALFGEPRLVVLDEPNAALDGNGEQRLIETLHALQSRGVTTVIVAHKPALIAHVDRVIAMHDGRVERIGEREQVLRQLFPVTLRHA
ncbi:MAG: type I secretion system permease/ATPase [Gammaproteobacteria bacterium]|nr:type I secretion system permease/ATPase [Gammaproteobacteria bacterium]